MEDTWGWGLLYVLYYLEDMVINWEVVFGVGWKYRYSSKDR